jgi:hypothetical protein
LYVLQYYEWIETSASIGRPDSVISRFVRKTTPKPCKSVNAAVRGNPQKQSAIVKSGEYSRKIHPRMKALTEEIRRLLGQGWRVGVKREGGLLIYEVRARIGNRMRADEVWFTHSKSSGNRGGYAVPDPETFTEVRLEDVCYCYDPVYGTPYIISELAGEFDR